MNSFYLILLTTGLLSTSSFADIRLPKIFSDGMVLQREKPITLWGWAEPGEKVTARFKTQTLSVNSDEKGQWKIALAAEPAGGPHELTLQGRNQIKISDVLVGDVWICSGQSNMEWTVQKSLNGDKEIRAANFPNVRQFLVEKSIASQPKEDVKSGNWSAALPQTVGDFTAVGYFFARELNQKTGVPIGLIHTSWGGTHVETWTRREAFLESKEFKSMIEKMPLIDLEELATQRKRDISSHLKSLGLTLPQGKSPLSWKNPNYPTSHWPKMTVPQIWEKTLGEIDGVVWFRKQITLTAEQIDKSAVLYLGTIDDNDETFVNGVKVGETRSWNTQRAYPLPAKLLKPGTNTIAIKVTDNGGAGGLYGDPKDLALSLPNGRRLSLAGEWQYQVQEIYYNNLISPNSYPTLLYNSMLHPLRNYGIRGAIWYQGESNASRAYQYRQAFPLMITDWRKQFNQGDFPFYFVQLASFNENGGNSQKGSTWAELREAQSMTLSLPETGMAVTTDIGEANDIHPRNKQEVGKRLAALALNRSYHIKMVDSGPTFSKMSIDGNKIRLQFTQTGSGLVINDKYGYLKGFEVAGSDQKFSYAQARLDGNTVVLSSEAVPQPVAVRFGWADNPEEANLINQEGFPAVPFRTDQWQGITEHEKFAF